MMSVGCPVCGYGVDWSLWPAFRWLKSGHVYLYFALGFMLWEYLCPGCVVWARRLGAEWDGKLETRFEGWRVS